MTNDLTDRVVETVNHQVHGPEEYSPETEIVQILAAHANHDPDEVRAALSYAVERGDLVKEEEGCRVKE